MLKLHCTYCRHLLATKNAKSSGSHLAVQQLDLLALLQNLHAEQLVQQRQLPHGALSLVHPLSPSF